MAGAMEWNPVINGLHIGQLVEVQSGDRSSDAIGQVGQLQGYDPDAKRFIVSLLESGEELRVDPECVVSAPIETTGADAFDVVLGPMTDKSVLGETMSNCLMEKGFCVLKIIQPAEDRTMLLEQVKQEERCGKLGRLASEVEEGYLGKSGRAKVMWLDPESADVADDSPLMKTDATITSLAEILHYYTEDAIGTPIGERTPALVCMSMTNLDEAEYEAPVATDKMIEEYYSTWCRSVLRLVHFSGKDAGTALLTRKESSPLSSLEPTHEVTAAHNTILVVREDAYEYSYEEPEHGEQCWLQSFFMKEGPQWALGELDGDFSVFDTMADGPPPPTEAAKNLVAVVAISLQACGKMTDHKKEWAAYIAGTDGQLEMPFARFEYLPYYNDEVDIPQGTTFVKHFSVQEGVEMFDNRSFEISNAESEAMDPQCRQCLEVGYLSLMHLGITKKYCNTNPIHASVSVGCDKQEWLNMSGVTRSVATNNQLAITANRFNYVFNLKGGSYVCDTACSSSLVATHLGKVNILERRWDPLEWHLGMGTGMTLTVFAFIGRCASHMASPGGRCFTFNATANGYNVGDGTAGMVIKAGSCDDHRLAYLRGTQMGQDGRSASMSAPNGPAQEKCIWGAIREAQMQPPESTTWECHGTGTSLGDPIEVGAVRKVQIKMKRLEPLMIASSKGNFGHLEGSAAAIAMNKCVMVVIMNTCAPTQHLKTLNPHLDHAAFDAIFISEHNPYKYKQGHCQVSSFGVGGTNGHAIFWGEAMKPAVDYRKKFFNKVMGKAAITAEGSNPANWEYSGMGYSPKPGERYKIVFSKDPLTKEETVMYEKVEEEEEVPPEFYSTTGTHNEWGEDRMMDGDVPGLFYQEVEIPESGELEFRILAEGDTTRCIAPRVTTSRKMEQIVGPGEHDMSWVIRGAGLSPMRIEFFAPVTTAVEGMRTIAWYPIQDE